LTDERCRAGVEVAERYVDGLASQAEVGTAADRAFEAFRAAEHNSPAWWACIVAGTAARAQEHRWSDWKVPNAMSHLDLTASELPATLLRDIFGNPFAAPRALDPRLLTPGVLALAQTAYDDRKLPEGSLDPARLAVLADALEAAGCTDAELLAHLRSQGPHVRGCFAVDVVLAKE
jgi:hypothetical protein